MKRRVRGVPFSRFSANETVIRMTRPNMVKSHEQPRSAGENGLTGVI